MSLLIPSFFAGVLTVLAPCVFTLLPVILGGSASEKNMKKPIIIISSLALSIVLFSILLKGTTYFLSIPPKVWNTISGGILLVFGIIMIFPNVWNCINIKLKLYQSEIFLQKSGKGENIRSAIFLGASLGPVFTTCSPTYALILSIILPTSFILGLLNLASYTLGLSIILLLIAYGGQKVVTKLNFATNPNGLLKKILGILILLTGFFIITGIDKSIETAFLDAGYLGPIQIEQKLIKNFDSGQDVFSMGT
jgi:cytochrome c-type biogenesis protein